eukprot:1977418-Prymnesium_polylepis.1
MAGDAAPQGARAGRAGGHVAPQRDDGGGRALPRLRPGEGTPAIRLCHSPVPLPRTPLPLVPSAGTPAIRLCHSPVPLPRAPLPLVPSAAALI